MRWLSCAAQAITLYAASGLLHLPIQPVPLIAVFFLSVLSNLALAYIPSRLKESSRVLGAIQIADVIILTLILYYSGGPENPFSIFYLLHVVLSAVLMDLFWAWGMAFLSAALFGLLFLVQSKASQHHHGMALPAEMPGQLSAHLLGMWLAYLCVAVITAYFVSRISSELRRIDRSTTELKLNQQRLSSLTTLSAGAAHELSTPLGTIAIALGEIQHKNSGSVSESQFGADLNLIKNQIDRCREILRKMRGRSGEVSGEAFVSVRVSELLDELKTAFADMRYSSVQVKDGSFNGELVNVPKNALVGAVLALAKNAVEASDGNPVTISAALSDTTCELTVSDSGCGMKPETLARVGEPFFTTKADGAGMGLGVFLARLTSESLGGRVDIQSKMGQGTSATLSIPRERNAGIRKRN